MPLPDFTQGVEGDMPLHAPALLASGVDGLFGGGGGLA